MTPQQFKAWRAHMKLNRAQAARLLNVGKNTPALWETGRVEIPFGADILCAAIALKIKAWSEYQKKETDE